MLQPMSFRAPHGDTSFFTWHFNKDWIDSMLVSMAESSGNGGGPPAEQWAHRTPILFPLINMILYGMGTPLGLAVWISALAAVWKCSVHDDRLWKNIVNSDRLVIFVISFYGYTVCEKYPLYVTGLSDFVSFSRLGNFFFVEKIQRQKDNSSGSDFSFGCGRSLFMGISLVKTIYIAAAFPRGSGDMDL
jgi:hypothetical protein